MRADAQHNRERLLVTARAMARQQGTSPSLNALARRARVGVATVYRHFPDPDALMTALMEGPLRELERLFDQAKRESRPDLALKMLFVGVLELQLANPIVAHLVHAPQTTSEPVKQILARMQGAAADLIQRARRAKLVSASITGDDVCRLLLGVHAAALAGDEPRTAARRYAEIVLAGLQPRSRQRAAI